MTTSAIAEIKREKEKKKGFKAASVNDPLLIRMMVLTFKSFSTNVYHLFIISFVETVITRNLRSSPCMC